MIASRGCAVHAGHQETLRLGDPGKAHGGGGRPGVASAPARLGAFSGSSSTRASACSRPVAQQCRGHGRESDLPGSLLQRGTSDAHKLAAAALARRRPRRASTGQLSTWQERAGPPLFPKLSVLQPLTAALVRPQRIHETAYKGKVDKKTLKEKGGQRRQHRWGPEKPRHSHTKKERQDRFVTDAPRTLTAARPRSTPANPAAGRGEREHDSPHHRLHGGNRPSAGIAAVELRWRSRVQGLPRRRRDQPKS